LKERFEGDEVGIVIGNIDVQDVRFDCAAHINWRRVPKTIDEQGTTDLQV